MIPKAVLIISNFILLISAALAFTEPAGSRITLPNGKKVFISGMNLAWINFANDVGNKPLDTLKLSVAMKNISDSGANCMRIWLSTNGTNDPIYNSQGLVSGPGAYTISNIQEMLKLAKNYNILLLPVLLTHNWLDKSVDPTILTYNKKMLTTEEGLNAYINNYIKPVVTAIGADSNLLCWEIFSKPEGIFEGGSSEENAVTKEQVQKSINWISSAIKDIVPEVLVSIGATTIESLNLYTDGALRVAGGKQNGILDFYMAHYFGWNGPLNSPFSKNYASWNLDKPLVIGEFASSDWSSLINSDIPLLDSAKVDTLLCFLNDAGYAGGLGWQYQEDSNHPWMDGFSTFGHSIAEVYRKDSNSIKLDRISSNHYAVLFSAGIGGRVTTSANGRVDSGATVTINAIPDWGYTFKCWEGDIKSSEPVIVLLNVDKNYILQAVFTPGEGINLARSGNFSDSTLWNFEVDESAGNSAEISFNNQQVTITFSKSDTSDHSTHYVQLSQDGIELDGGIEYYLTFDGWSTIECPLFAGLVEEDSWQSGKEVTLGTTQSAFCLSLFPEATTNSGVIKFKAGKYGAPVYIDNVILVRSEKSAIKNGYFTLRNKNTSYRCIGDKLIWKAQSKDAVAQVFDLSGKLLRPATTNRTISLSGVRSGMYLLKINDKNGSRMFRISRY